MKDKKLKGIIDKDPKSFLIIWGEWFFKVRSYTPIPIYSIMIFCFWWEWENDILLWILGLLFVISGECIRLWALRYIGKFSRTRKSKVRILVTDGPYAFMRNPLYCGNLFILLGTTILSELVWLVPIVTILFFLQYHCIVLWEEATLLEHFCGDARSYFEFVPRWFPKRQMKKIDPQTYTLPRYFWRDVLKREKPTLQGILVMLVVMILKELSY